MTRATISRVRRGLPCGRAPLFLALAALGAAACAAIAGLEAPEQEAEIDASLPTRDAASGNVDGDPGPPTASFELVCNGSPLKRHVNCETKRWEFEACPLILDAGRTLVLRNTGEYAIAYIARRNWPGTRA